MTFYLTFGQKYPWRSGWVEVEADTMPEAREMVTDIFGTHWSNLYYENKFDKSMFPQGKIGHTIK